MIQYSLQRTQAEHGQLLIGNEHVYAVEYRIDDLYPQYRGRLVTSSWDTADVAQALASSERAQLVFAGNTIAFEIALARSLHDDVWQFQSVVWSQEGKNTQSSGIYGSEQTGQEFPKTNFF